MGKSPFSEQVRWDPLAMAKDISAVRGLMLIKFSQIGEMWCVGARVEDPPARCRFRGDLTQGTGGVHRGV